MKSNQKKAFSLIEIILVVLILSVVAGLIIPDFSHTYSQAQLQKAANGLAYLMRYAQNRAIVKNFRIRLEFDSDFSKYWLCEEIPGSRQKTDVAMFKKISGRFARITKIDDKIKIEADTQMIYFYPDGTIDKQRIRMCNDNRCLTVSTREQRGNVRIF